MLTSRQWIDSTHGVRFSAWQMSYSSARSFSSPRNGGRSLGGFAIQRASRIAGAAAQIRRITGMSMLSRILLCDSGVGHFSSHRMRCRENTVLQRKQLGPGHGRRSVWPQSSIFFYRGLLYFFFKQRSP